MTAFVNHDNKIIFVHTPKTGGTSITDCMVGLSNLAQAEALFGMPTKNVYYWDDDEGHATCKQLRDKFKDYDDYSLIKLAGDKIIFRVFDKAYLSYIQSMSNQLNYSRVYNLNSRKFKVIENEKMIVVSDKNGGIIEIILF